MKYYEKWFLLLLSSIWHLKSSYPFFSCFNYFKFIMKYDSLWTFFSCHMCIWVFGFLPKNQLPWIFYPFQAKVSSKRYKACKDTKRQCKMCDVTPTPRQQRAPKAVDEDLYKIPPELLLESQRRRRVDHLLPLLVDNLVTSLHYNVKTTRNVPLIWRHCFLSNLDICSGTITGSCQIDRTAGPFMCSP